MTSSHAAHTVPDPDVAAVVHEELDRLTDRERLPVVLCDLEGLTYEQAAGQLRWTEPTLRHRLVKARHRLRERLTRRGVTAGVVGTALAALDGRSQGGGPGGPGPLGGRAAATGGTASASAAALSSCLIRSMTMTKLKLAAAGVLAAMAIASAGASRPGSAGPTGPGPRCGPRMGRGPPDRPRPPMPRPGRSRPDRDRASRAGSSTSKAGPSPAPGSRSIVWTARDGDLADGSNGPATTASPLEEGLSYLTADPTTATTGPDGRFRLTGVGPDQVAELYISGPTIATAELYATDATGRHPRHSASGSRPNRSSIYARRFEYAAEPGRPIEGFIRDKDTGRPIAGVGLRAAVYDERSLISAPGISATSDASGHYRLTGLPGRRSIVSSRTAEGQPYIEAASAPRPRPRLSSR